MSETEKQLEEMTMPELWAEATRLGLSKEGKKDELIARLKKAKEEGGGKNMTEQIQKTKTTKQTEAVYISKYLQLRLVRESAYTKEVNGRAFTVPGKSIQFIDGVYKTSDPEEIDFLDNHGNYGNTYTKVEKSDIGKATSDLIDNQWKTLEQKEAELKIKEEDLKQREMALRGSAEGADKTTTVEGTDEKPKFE